MSRSTGRTLDLFEVFARERRPLSLSELSKAIGVAPSSCFSIVKTLKSRGFLYEVGERKALYPTRRMLERSLAIAEHEPHLMQLVPVMETLRDATGETIILGRRQSNEIVYLKVVEGLHTVRYTAQVGELKPMHSSAIGKVVLGALDRADRLALIEKLPLRQMTDNTISDRGRLVADLDEGIARGYQMTLGENVADVVAIAMPVKIGNDEFGICIAGPRHRMEPRHAELAAIIASTLQSFASGKMRGRS
ncbi:IclR family transcriptional regulator [Pararhizobium haloflavum]|uniref:IclR family transcriptional regulator n=1 Tax=Pararhizobium haloflavum TaxID=2037914 RepID=UPI000C1887A9|nr:IclR family transcriptional regulator [Pararhizobium haloflavum]